MAVSLLFPPLEELDFKMYGVQEGSGIECSLPHMTMVGWCLYNPLFSFPLFGGPLPLYFVFLCSRSEETITHLYPVKTIRPLIGALKLFAG